MKSKTIIIDYNFLINGDMRRIFNKDTCDLHKFVKKLSFYFELKIYSRRNKTSIIRYLEENELLDNISAITTKKDNCLLFLNLDSMNSIDYIVRAYFE